MPLGKSKVQFVLMPRNDGNQLFLQPRSRRVPQKRKAIYSTIVIKKSHSQPYSLHVPTAEIYSFNTSFFPHSETQQPLFLPLTW